MQYGGNIPDFGSNVPIHAVRLATLFFIFFNANTGSEISSDCNQF